MTRGLVILLIQNASSLPLQNETIAVQILLQFPEDMSRRVLHITQTGQRPRLVDIAPEAEAPPSKRDAIFEREVSMQRLSRRSALFVYINLTSTSES